MALWSSRDYSLLAATSLSYPVHAHCWDPHTAYEFATVGAGQNGGGVCFWMVEEVMGGKECQFKVWRGRERKRERGREREGGREGLQHTIHVLRYMNLVFLRIC